MILEKINDMYKMDDFHQFNILNIKDLNNKLFCTFTPLEHLDELLTHITSSYVIMYGKIFVLHVKSNDEYVCTYNVEQGNVNDLPENTILVHRKKDSNTLYTINALNDLIKSLNGGVLDTSFTVNWKDYQNCILLTHSGDLKKLDTKIYKIITL